MRCFNEAREIVIQEYMNIKKDILKRESEQEKGKDKKEETPAEEEEEEDGEIDFENFKVLDMLDDDAELIERNPEDWMIKATQLLKKWRES